MAYILLRYDLQKENLANLDYSRVSRPNLKKAFHFKSSCVRKITKRSCRLLTIADY